VDLPYLLFKAIFRFPILKTSTIYGSVLQRGKNIISHRFQPVVDYRQDIVLKEFLPFEAKNVTKRVMRKMSK
jgi:hypothetical protein